MALTQITQSLLQRIEELSGKPVIVQTDRSVPQATIKMARGTAPAHVVFYNPSLEGSADYAICFQCGFALRLFLAPESKRFEVRTTVPGRKEADALLGSHLKRVGMSLPQPLRLQLRDQLYDGLILQLRSMPIALRVDAWLRHEYLDLIDQQRSSIVRQLNENAACLRPEVRKISPEKILRPSTAMNAAYALFWSRTWSDPLLVVPYKTSANLAGGEGLLKLWDEIPDDPTTDKELIQAWGDHLKLGGWYEVVPFDAPGKA
jgi:hypothetical protein